MAKGHIFWVFFFFFFPHLVAPRAMAPKLPGPPRPEGPLVPRLCRGFAPPRGGGNAENRRRRRGGGGGALPPAGEGGRAEPPPKLPPVRGAENRRHQHAQGSWAALSDRVGLPAARPAGGGRAGIRRLAVRPRSRWRRRLDAPGDTERPAHFHDHGQRHDPACGRERYGGRGGDAQGRCDRPVAGMRCRIEMVPGSGRRVQGLFAARPDLGIAAG